MAGAHKPAAVTAHHPGHRHCGTTACSVRLAVVCICSEPCATKLLGNASCVLAGGQQATMGQCTCHRAHAAQYQPVRQPASHCCALLWYCSSMGAACTALASHPVNVRLAGREELDTTAAALLQVQPDVKVVDGSQHLAPAHHRHRQVLHGTTLH